MTNNTNNSERALRPTKSHYTLKYYFVNIYQLNNLITRTENGADRAELEDQVKVLENSQIKMDTFVKAHENSFSLFGWLIKPFVK